MLAKEFSLSGDLSDQHLNQQRGQGQPGCDFRGLFQRYSIFPAEHAQRKRREHQQNPAIHTAAGVQCTPAQPEPVLRLLEK